MVMQNLGGKQGALWSLSTQEKLKVIRTQIVFFLSFFWGRGGGKGGGELNKMHHVQYESGE